MKLFNKHISFWISICLLGLLACNKGETVLPEPSHRVIVTSEMDFENKIRVDGIISFGDVSAGVVSRTWTFPEGAVDILEADNDLTSEAANIKARFLKAGVFEVNLQQEFEEAAYVGGTVKDKNLDTTIVVTVLDSIQASVKAYYINPDGSTGAELVMENDANNEVRAGSTLRFAYEVVGEPLVFRWDFDGGNPGTFDGDAPEVDIKYSQLGTYGLSFIASRVRPGGRDSVVFKNLISVVPSPDPVTLDAVKKQDADIALVFSREMEGSSVSASDFSVVIENAGNTFNPTVGAAKLDPNQGNIVLLTVSGETLYDDDVVKVSYTPGSLKTTDAVNADPFTDQIMTVEKVNLLASTTYDYSFENSFESNWTYLGWGAPWDGYTLAITNEKSQDGGKSMQVDMAAAGGMIIGHKDQNGEHVFFDVDKDKDYEIGVWVYVETIGSTPAAEEQPNLRFFWNPDTDWAVGDNPNLAALPVGQWTYSSTFAKFNQTAPTRFMIRGVNTKNPEAIKIFVDNITLAEVSLRP